MEWDGREGKGREWKRYDLRMQLQFVLYAARHDNCLLRLIWESIALYIPTNAQMINEPAWPTISKFNVPVSAITQTVSVCTHTVPLPSPNDDTFGEPIIQ